jgi:hypothetical protein
MIKSITLNQTVFQVKGNIVSSMGGEKVMLSVSKGKYFNLGEIGGEIWDIIQEPNTVRQIIETLISEYDVDQTECEEQVLSFLDHLKGEGLIETSDLK